MQFAARLRERVIGGEITCSVRIWQRRHVKVGGCYQLGGGAIEVTRISEIGFDDITPALARRSGFEGVVDLLRVAKHGPAERVFLVEFVWRPGQPDAPARTAVRPTEGPASSIRVRRQPPKR
jgi:hypothetical protein